MNKTSKVKGALEVMVVIGLILVIPLFFAIKTAADRQAVQKTPMPPAPTASEVPETNSVITAQQPPQCTFPLAQTTTAEPVPEEYTFSEPQVVITVSSKTPDSQFWLSEPQPDIIKWLPDNQNVLIMPSKLIDLNMNGYQQTIELFNPETKEIQIYATRRNVDKAPPAWNPALNAIVYADMNVLKGSTGSNFKFTRQLRISYGNPDDTQVLADDLPQYGMAVKPDGSQIAYFTAKQLVKLDTSLNAVASVVFDRKALDFKRKNPNTVDAVDYKMAWRPNSSQIFVYNWAGDNLGYTYIMDTDSGQICSLDFGGWAEIARWSPNGRYLAIVRAQGSIPVESADVVVLDTTTGEFYTPDMIQPEATGEYFAQDIEWAPDNRHLLFTFIDAATYSQNTFTYEGSLYLGDIVSGQVDRIFPSYQLNVYRGTINMAWSPDGSKLLINCPTPEGDELVCLVSVQTPGE